MGERKDLREKLKELVIFNSPSAVIDGVMEIIRQETDRAREEERKHLSRRLVVGIKTLKEKYIDDTEISHGKIDDFIVNEIGGELKEYYKGGWGWYS